MTPTLPAFVVALVAIALFFTAYAIARAACQLITTMLKAIAPLLARVLTPSLPAPDYSPLFEG